MRERVSRELRRRHSTVGFAILVWCLAGSGVGLSQAAERVVLCEQFSRVTCGYCANAGPALGMMIDNYPGTFAAIQVHVSDDFEIGWGYYRCVNFYGISGLPTAEFDGGLYEVVGAGSIQSAYNNYEYCYNQRRQELTDVLIDVAACETGEQTYQVNARVELEEGGAAKSVKVFMVQLLDHWPTEPPQGVEYSRNGLKQVASAQTISLVPGEALTVSRSFTFDAESWAAQDDIKIVVWAQESALSGPVEVYQAAEMAWPFPDDCNENGRGDDLDLTVGSSLDCNGNGIPDECDIVTGYSQDADGNGYPDECDKLGDCDCDGLVGYFDIQYFLAAIESEQAWRDLHVAQSGVEPQCSFENCDVDGSGLVDYFDINPFLAALGS